MRISDWSSDVCSSDLALLDLGEGHLEAGRRLLADDGGDLRRPIVARLVQGRQDRLDRGCGKAARDEVTLPRQLGGGGVRLEALDGAIDQRLRVVAPPLLLGEGFGQRVHALRSEEHTSELQSLMRISYAVFCLKKKKIQHEY